MHKLNQTKLQHGLDTFYAIIPANEQITTILQDSCTVLLKYCNRNSSIIYAGLRYVCKLNPLTLTDVIRVQQL